MQKIISIGSWACEKHGQKGKIIIVSLALLFSFGRCLGMQEERQNDETACHKSCEQTCCSVCGILLGSCYHAVAGAGKYYVAGSGKLGAYCCHDKLGWLGARPSEVNLLCGGVLAVISATQLHMPDHSCLCGRCRKMARAIACRRNGAPRPMTMDEKKD